MESLPSKEEYDRAEIALSHIERVAKFELPAIETAQGVNKKRPWRSAVRNAYREHPEGGFAVCAPPLERPNQDKPLLIIIHPGDAIEDGIGYGDPVAAAEVVEFGRKNVIAMAKEIEEKMATHDVVVLHRQSSVDTFMRSDYGQFLKIEKDIKPYSKICIKASDQGQVLFGDDLDACADWILKNMKAKDRPHIFMTGAYACAEWGCITHVGRNLLRAGCESITLSEHSPTDSSNFQPRWDPSSDQRVLKRQHKP
jgi:hypothetical protein